MNREEMIMTLVINHMEDKETLEQSSTEQLEMMMKYYHEI